MVSPRPALPFVRLFPSNPQSTTETKSNPYPSYHLPSSFHLLIHRAERECRVFCWDLVTLHPAVSLPVGSPLSRDDRCSSCPTPKSVGGERAPRISEHQYSGRERAQIDADVEG